MSENKTIEEKMTDYVLKYYDDIKYIFLGSTLLHIWSNLENQSGLLMTIKKKFENFEKNISERFVKHSIDIGSENVERNVIIRRESIYIEDFFKKECENCFKASIFSKEIIVNSEKRHHFQLLEGSEYYKIKKSQYEPHLSPSLSYRYSCKKDKGVISFMIRCYHELNTEISSLENQIISNMLNTKSFNMKVLSYNDNLIKSFENYRMEKSFSAFSEEEILKIDFYENTSSIVNPIYELTFVSYYCAFNLTNGNHIMVDENKNMRTNAAVCSLTKIFLNDLYRTKEGIIGLIRNEWLNYGHSFEDVFTCKIFEIWLLAIKLWVWKFPEYFGFDITLLEDLRIQLHMKENYPFTNKNLSIDVLTKLSSRIIETGKNKASRLYSLVGLFFNHSNKVILPKSKKMLEEISDDEKVWSDLIMVFIRK